ncbi:MAG: hypothetical protein HGA85_07480, partial [Nanoarchaeota archaeon]|nr:hypothetical protein [Nanoarchaeota archaeon]
MDSNYCGYLYICNGIGEPITSMIEVTYKGTAEQAERIGNMAFALNHKLTKKGYQVYLNKGINAVAKNDSIIRFTQTTPGEEEHERFHLAVRKATDLREYERIGANLMDESFAYSIQDFVDWTQAVDDPSGHEGFTQKPIKDKISRSQKNGRRLASYYNQILRHKERGDISCQTFQQAIDYCNE